MSAIQNSSPQFARQSEASSRNSRFVLDRDLISITSSSAVQVVFRTHPLPPGPRHDCHVSGPEFCHRSVSQFHGSAAVSPTLDVQQIHDVTLQLEMFSFGPGPQTTSP
jgi:hypothetical protein